MAAREPVHAAYFLFGWSGRCKLDCQIDSDGVCVSVITERSVVSVKTEMYLEWVQPKGKEWRWNRAPARAMHDNGTYHAGIRAEIM